MPIIMRTDSDNIVHQVWAQEQAESCAVASIWMARNQALQMTINQDEWSLAWELYGKVVQNMPLTPRPPVSLDPRMFHEDQSTFENMFSRYGTYMYQVVQALRNEGLNVTWESKLLLSINPQRLSYTTPAILLLGWYDRKIKIRYGGHFIVASRVSNSGRIVYLDPWQGQLKELGYGPLYPGGGVFEEVAYISA